MIFKKNLFFIVLFIYIAACHPGGDFQKQIGNTDLTYFNGGGLNKYIIGPRSKNEKSIILVEPEILIFSNEGDHVFGLRQVVNHYHCSDPITGVAEVTDRLEFFIINVSSNALSYEPVVFSDYLEFKSFSQDLGISSEAINALMPDRNEKKILHVRNSLDRCPVENRTSLTQIIKSN